MNIEELAAKVEWEGGVMEAIQYGIKTTDFDADITERFPELVDAWDNLEQTVGDIYTIAQVLDQFNI